MKFDVDCVRNCLIKNSAVFTVRSYLYEGEWSKFDGKWIKRFLIKEIKSKEDLRDFVKLSGFNTINDWWSKIKVFCGNKRKYLYRVILQE